jgi:lysophospholipase L1-like esterase
VLNAGLSGNRVLNGSACFGEKATARFQRDVLDRPGVRSVIVMAGINDITYPLMDSPCSRPNPAVTAEQIIEGHRALIRAARARGVKVIGGTIVPFKGNPRLYPEDNAQTLAMERTRDAVNQWIRSGGEYDAVVDFERVLADPADPDRLRPEYNTRDGQEGDWLHPTTPASTPWPGRSTSPRSDERERPCSARWCRHASPSAACRSTPCSAWRALRRTELAEQPQRQPARPQQRDAGQPQAPGGERRLQDDLLVRPLARDLRAQHGHGPAHLLLPEPQPGPAVAVQVGGLPP